MKFKKYIKFVTFLLLVVFILLNYSSALALTPPVPNPSPSPVGSILPTSTQTGLSDRSVKDILVGVLEWLLGIVAIVALIGFVVSGIMYLMAAGDEKMADKGKAGMAFSIIGITVVLGAFVIIQAIDYALRGSGSSFLFN